MSGGDFLRINYHKTCHEFIEKSLDDQGNFVTIIHQNKGLENHRVKQPDRYHLMEEQLVLSERGTWYTVDQAAQTIHKAQMSGRHLQVIPLDKRVVHLNSLLDTNHDLEWFKTHDINIRAPLCINRFCKIKEEGPEEVNRFSWFIYKNAMQIYRKSKSEWEANGRVGDAPVEPGGDNWGGKNMFKDLSNKRCYSKKSELYSENAVINFILITNDMHSSKHSLYTLFCNGSYFIIYVSIKISIFILHAITDCA